MVDDVQKLLEYMTDMLGNDPDNRSVTFSLKNIVEIEDINRKIERLLRQLEIEGMIEQYELKEEYEVSVKLSRKSLICLKDKSGNVSKYTIGNEIEKEKIIVAGVVKQEVYIENIRRKKLKELLVGGGIVVLITTIGCWNENLGINRAFLILLGIFMGLEAKIQPKTIQAYLGHATLQMTMDLYTHVTDEFKQDEIGKLEEEENKVQYAENLYA